MYNHAYHRSFVYKVWNAQKPDEIINTFADTLALIREIHRFTAGVPQVCYLVGWQYDGHDSKYPAWGAANHRLKRPEDASPEDSLRWLMREAKRYNAIVSLHINMCDAYESSPLWDEYVRNDLLIRDTDGSLKKGGVWGGEQSYLVSKAREWTSGHAGRRIDALLDMLPIADAGTIHIDVFQPTPSPYHNVSRSDDLAAMAAILDYWRSRGVDVTTEWWHHELVGKVPMVWHSNFDESSRLRYPPELACGGGSAWNMRADHADRPGGFSKTPEPGCRYEEAWGESIDGDIARDPAAAADVFYTKTLSFIFLNDYRAMRHEITAATYSVDFTDDVRTEIRVAERRLTLRQDGRLLIDGPHRFLPAGWRDDGSYIAHSQTGGDTEWALPPAWKSITQARVTPLWPESGTPTVVPIVGSRIVLPLAPQAAALVTPA